jgi:alginate O-acetyltransferase complex protein AlgJ
MQITADALANFINENIDLPSIKSAAYIRHAMHFSGEGDIAAMLKLPAQQKMFSSQAVTIEQIKTSEDEMWRPDENADILLLGDSFTNIYSLEGMGWGEAAGFAEQLSFALQRPLDRIAINAGGALSSRQELWKQMQRGRDRLRGKRLVIYEFAARDLYSGDWRLFTLPPPQKR